MPRKKTPSRKKLTKAERRESIGMRLTEAAARCELLTMIGTKQTKELAASALRFIKKAHAEFRDM